MSDERRKERRGREAFRICCLVGKNGKPLTEEEMTFRVQERRAM